MTLWHYLLLIGSVLLGGGAGLLGAGRRLQPHLPLLLSFSGAYLLGIAALELMPAAFGSHIHDGGLWLLAGFFVQLLLESLSQGVEHGHVHAHRRAGLGFAVQIMIGLGLHSLLEGLPLGAAGEGMDLHTGHDHGHTHGTGGALNLLVGIALHKVPAAFALALLLVSSGYARRLAWGCLLLFALLTPAGALLGEILPIDDHWRSRILALVVGSLLHVSTTILFEVDGSRTHRVSTEKFAVIVLGVAVAYLTNH